MSKSLKSKGYTLIEIVIVIAILAILSTVTASVYKRYQTSQALDKDTALVSSLLNQSRVLTLSSKDNVKHGLYLEANQVTLFSGSSYVVGTSTNVVFPLNNTVSLSATLPSGTTSIIFERLTGKTFQNGTITLTSLVNPSSTKSITIYGSGIIQNN